MTEVGYRIGSSQGVGCHASIEDSIVILGPPRSGKGLDLAIPLILDAPGAVVATSTRPDNLAVTLRRRAARGPVAVFDPQGLARGIPSSTRWSPFRGCQDPHIAMIRAKALTARTADGTTDANFWQASAEQAVRCSSMPPRSAAAPPVACTGGPSPRRTPATPSSSSLPTTRPRHHHHLAGTR